MYPEITEINETQLKVTYDKLPWFPYCLIWAGYFSSLYYLNSFSPDRWLFSFFLVTLILLIFYISGFTTRFIKKEIFLFDSMKKEIFKNGEVYQKYDDIKEIIIDEISGDCSDDYELILKFSKGKLNLGRDIDRNKVVERQNQVNGFIKTV
ncbi:hypothetical protein J8L98_18840 [Pseudoalteromonas sp. MMG013]|uniref:hypothetical protein n=1 Tax=Pseudoalteromonas sp. MMG013 TaxID=2822687 RepID=UPI001B38CF2A|nr:hypothetical protein [Pseudoalteromonas sp. MMG013]MBQ4863743.1 hypothetical protein [Pseudoalteromonas sp. MMG013]